MKNAFSITDKYIPSENEIRHADSLLTEEQIKMSKKRLEGSTAEREKYYLPRIEELEKAQKKLGEGLFHAHGLRAELNELYRLKSGSSQMHSINYASIYEDMKNNKERIMSVLDGLDDDIMVRVHSAQRCWDKDSEWAEREFLGTTTQAKQYFNKKIYEKQEGVVYHDEFDDNDYCKSDEAIFFTDENNKYRKIRIDILGKIPQTADEIDECLKNVTPEDYYNNMSPHIEEMTLSHPLAICGSDYPSFCHYKILPKDKIIFYTKGYDEGYPYEKTLLYDFEAFKKMINEKKTQNLAEIARISSEIESGNTLLETIKEYQIINNK